MERQRIREILVPLDGSKNSQRSLETGIHLALEHEASLTVIYVIHSFSKNVRKKSPSEPLPQFLIQATKLVEKNGIPFHARVLEGDPGHSILEYADTHGTDLIVIGARGLGTFKKMFLGSVSNYVLHKAKVAVMLIK